MFSFVDFFSFLPGVAEQFALAEAAMSAWSMTDCVDEATTSVQGENKTRAPTCHPQRKHRPQQGVLTTNVCESSIASLCYQCCVLTMMQKMCLHIKHEIDILLIFSSLSLI